MNAKKIKILSLLLALIFLLSGCAFFYQSSVPEAEPVEPKSNSTYEVVNDNQPQFTQDQITDESYEFYSELDELGRCGYTMACIGVDIMPTTERGSIGQVKPSGWHTVKYDCVDGGYLYNRCHLIGYQLTGENANERNLITGTRYLNVEGMLPFEDMVADFVKETEYHVMYRVTPVFEGYELVARGVQMEAWSVEDNGEGVCFNVYVYNQQPGVIINYADGSSSLKSSGNATETTAIVEEALYIINLNSGKFHRESCNNAQTISDLNRMESTAGRQVLIDMGYEPAGCCAP